MQPYIYLYGQIMTTWAFLLKNPFPAPDGYCEIAQKDHFVGGETGTAAVVLCSLGAAVKLGGTHVGKCDCDTIFGAFSGKNCDLSELETEEFDGVCDYVFIDKSTRTCFGEWEKHFSRKIPFFSPPSEESVKNCACMAADPFFGDEAAKLALKYGKKYLTIDCRHDSFIHKNSAVNCVSHQYLESYYPNTDMEKLYEMYTENTFGLVIFTLGEKGAMFGRKGEKPQFCPAFEVETVSTLGAGDTFKGAAAFGLFKGMSDRELVKFACAAAAVAVSRFPISEFPPTLNEIESLLDKV